MTLSKTPAPIKYGSKSHSTLCYAMMRRNCFSADEVRKCISGVFSDPERSLSRAKFACVFLQKNGLLDSCDQDKWVISELGKSMLYIAAHNYRLENARISGIRNVQNLARWRGRAPEILSMDDLG